jgi:hypothetical protein
VLFTFNVTFEAVLELVNFTPIRTPFKSLNPLSTDITFSAVPAAVEQLPI